MILTHEQYKQHRSSITDGGFMKGAEAASTSVLKPVFLCDAAESHLKETGRLLCFFRTFADQRVFEQTPEHNGV